MTHQTKQCALALNSVEILKSVLWWDRAGAMAAVSRSPPAASERRKRRDRTRWGPDDGDDAPSRDLPLPPGPAVVSVSVEGTTISDPSSNQPKRPKRSRWAAEEPDVKPSVPGLVVPVALPASLAGLVDANPQAMLLHRQLSVVSLLVSSCNSRAIFRPDHDLLYPCCLQQLLFHHQIMVRSELAAVLPGALYFVGHLYAHGALH